MVDVLGFAASGLTALSLTMTSIVRLRIVGLCGAVVFISYGLALSAWPIVVTNCASLSIHLFRLRPLLSTGDRERGVTGRGIGSGWPDDAN